MDLKKLRSEKNMTQIEVAVAVGVSLSSYRMWEVGVTTPNDKNMAKLKKVLGIN